MRLFLHLKSNRLYVELNRGTSESDLSDCVFYSRVGQAPGERIWCRPAAEFDDGRFVELSESEVLRWREQAQQHERE